MFLKPVAVAPAVVRRDGRVQAAGHRADHARLGLAEDLLDELCGNGGTIDEIARQCVLEGRVKGAVRRALTPALAVRFTLLMTLTPDADYAEVMALLLGDLPLVPWQRPYRAPTATVACTWREALGPRPLERLRDRLLAGIDAEHCEQDYRAVAAGGLEVCSIDGSLIRVADSDGQPGGVRVRGHRGRYLAVPAAAGAAVLGRLHPRCAGRGDRARRRRARPGQGRGRAGTAGYGAEGLPAGVHPGPGVGDGP